MKYVPTRPVPISREQYEEELRGFLARRDEERAELMRRVRIRDERELERHRPWPKNKRQRGES